MLQLKLESNKATIAELKMTRERLQQLVNDLKSQRTASVNASQNLLSEQKRLGDEMAGVKDKLQREIDDIVFRLGVQSKTIAGLEGFERKIVGDLEYVREKLAAVRHVMGEIEETMGRLGAMLDAVQERLDLQRDGVKRLNEERRAREQERNRAREEEEDMIERLRSQLLSEEKLRQGVDEYKQRLETDVTVVRRRIHTEAAKVKAAESYLAKVEAEAEDYRQGADAASAAIVELEEQQKGARAEMEDMKAKFGGDLEDVAERLEVDIRASAGLEGYRRNLGDELDIVKKKLGSRRSQFSRD